MSDHPRTNDEPIGHVLTRGWVADFLTRMALPVVAIPPQALYRVLLHGTGFQLAAEHSEVIVGCYVNYYVAARSEGQAGDRAIQRFKSRWRDFYPEARGTLVVDVERVECMQHKFARRSRTGFVFYRDGEEVEAR